MDSTAQAEGYLERSLAVNPSDYDAAYNLAVAKYRLGKLSDALKLFEAASEVFPDDEWLWIYIAEVKLGLKDYAGAIAAGERALEINPENGDAYRVMGYAYREQGNVEKATEMLRRWLEKSKKEE
jgi:tetratricopeptide (TPR) repeat protein